MEEYFPSLDPDSMRDDEGEDGEDGSHRDKSTEDPDSIDLGEEFLDENDEKILKSSDKAAIAHMLLRKSKKCAAKYLKFECIQNQTHLKENTLPDTVLSEVIDIFINPGLSIRNADTLKWLKWLISAGETPRDFYKTIEMFDNPTTCSLVWTADFMAYRCRTCGISPCMSLCLDCFHRGNHINHDYNMFKSQAGGACDCGNPAVMEKSGFCDRHKGSNPSNLSEPPDNLLILAKAILPKLLLRFILHCREHGNADLATIQVAMADAEIFIAFLQELCCKGAALRAVMREAFCNPKIYKSYTAINDGARYFDELLNCQSIYLEAIESIPFGDIPEGYEDLTTLHGPLEHNTFLEEFVFWTVKFEFPQKLVCLLLNMRPDSIYEDAFARAFVQHYSRIAVMLVQSTDTDTLSHRVVHVSVQLFSDNSLAYRMTDSYHLLHVMILSLKKMMSAICQQSTLHDIKKNNHQVAYCGHMVMKNHCYWPLVSDLNNILSFKNIAEKFLSDSKLLHEWISFLSLFQGMNNNIREIAKHVEYEPQYYYAAFSAELEASASPLWAVISHLKNAETRDYSVAVLKECLSGLSQWFNDIGLSQPDMKVYNEVSFHLPLHRSFALVLRQAVKKQGVNIREALPSTKMLSMMLIHPMRVQVAFHEILNDLWARNGLQIKGQAMTYVQCHFCNSMVDPDIFLLQIGAMEMPRDSFIISIFERFHSMDSLCFSMPPMFPGKDQTPAGSLDKENKITMLESCLTFLATITTNRHSIGLDEEDIILLEMMALICMGDKTHSQMMEHVPEKCFGSSVIDFESILKKVTKYCKPECAISGTMKQGTYVPQDHVWEDLFDPIFAQLRTLHKKDYQNSLNRFKQYCKDSKHLSKRKSSRLWPPYRLPSPVNDKYVDPRRLLTCRTFHAMLYVLFYKSLYEHIFCENILSLAVYLLELTINYHCKLDPADEGKELAASNPMEEEPRNECLDGLFYLWFSSDNIFFNSTVELNRVQLKTPVIIETPESQEDIASREIEMVEIENGETFLQLTDRVQQPSVRSLAAGSELVPYQEDAGAVMIPSQTNGTLINDSALDSPVSMNYSHSLEDSDHRQLTNSVQYPSLLSGSEVMRYVPPAQDGESRTTTVFNPRPRRLTGAAALPSGRDRDMVSSGLSYLPEGLISPNSALIQSLPTDENLRRTRCRTSVPSIEMANEYLTLRESIISLLIKLHSKLTSRIGSYRPNFNEDTIDSRIGDGPFFIAKVLNKLGRESQRSRDCILETVELLYPDGEEECSTSSEDESSSNAREEKKQKAKERQKKVMAAFARRQRQFMDKNWTKVPEAKNEELQMEVDIQKEKPANKLYDCVICNQHVLSTVERPVGLIVFIQATNLPGQRTTSPCSSCMPTSDRARARLRHQRYTLSQYMREKSEMLNNHFDTYSWYNSMDIGWEGGVYVQTCGHHIHLDCQSSYLLSLRAQEGNSPVDHMKNEFLCPFCRQLSNCVIPISSNIEETFMLIKMKSQKEDYVADIDLALKNLLIPSYGHEFVSYASALENALIEATTIEFPKSTGAPLNFELPQVSNPFLFLFVSSVFRINIEIELIQLGGSLVNVDEQSSFSKRSSLIPLLRILAFHAKLLNSNDPTKLGGMRGTHWVRQVWSSLTQRPIMDFKGAVTPHEREVPMMCRDPVSILLQFVLLLPPDIDPEYFQCLIYYIYRLVVVHASVSSLRSLPEKRREKVITDGPLSPLLALAYNNLRDSPFFYDDHQASSQVEDSKEWSINEFTCEVREICLTFLRIASILKSHMMEECLPLIADPLAECGALERYLGLWETCSVVNTAVMGKMCGVLISDNNLPSNGNVTTPSGVPVETLLGDLSGVTRIWCAQFESFASHSQVTAASIMMNVKFYQPKLLNLPPTFEELFQYYHQKKCPQCSSIPKDPAICLVCGTVVCLKQTCCKKNEVFETVRHASECGANTGVFLVITQSTILVVRGTRIGLWGCIHLDSFGEEDRDLKRGKPLFLSMHRYQLLEQQWLHHMFDHTPRRWIFHRGSV